MPALVLILALACTPVAVPAAEPPEGHVGLVLDDVSVLWASAQSVRLQLEGMERIHVAYPGLAGVEKQVDGEWRVLAVSRYESVSRAESYEAIGDGDDLGIDWAVVGVPAEEESFMVSAGTYRVCLRYWLDADGEKGDGPYTSCSRDFEIREPSEWATLE